MTQPHSKPETYVLHRSSVATPPRAVRGEGIYIFDQNGKSYLDACGGAAVSCLGHSDPAVRAAMHAQIDQIAYAHSGFFSSDAMEELAEDLVTHAPEGIAKAYFVSGGSEATEAALKMARQYFLEIGQPDRKYVIARRQSYHGNTLGALSVGGNMWRRKQFEPLLITASHIAPCYQYRDQLPGESDEAYGLRVANELETAIIELGADSVAAFVAEPVVGATSGAVAPVPGYFKRIREICDQYGVLLILDEVMCGMGRTGTLHAIEQEGIAGDLQTIAKGLGAGYQPIGAILVSKKIDDAIANGSGFFQHGHTYQGHATACAAALATQRTIRERDLLANVVKQGELLADGLRERFGQHPFVGDIRGRGLFRGVELVADRETKDPFDPSRKINTKIKKAAFARGLMAYPMGGTIDGVRGDHVLFAPPFIVTEDDVAKIVDLFELAINDVFAAEGLS
ncbi:aspartate aminotransferase family protein [Thalassospira xiamenensis]|uniref:Adenosylmethionine-8-amino-7-oxononanoate aminotransferase n=1 Tax=Thalassospira xiamenensis TaxID=220697 RepID=A0A285TVD1_9PROT|nr:aspartate aminotransferase family protein [Thalassospira xiamenensis]SOC28327.1 Adenosylmethionine-8-amino-7-oxononanoate aminotransferase [Thalassospira xiamenensis]